MPGDADIRLAAGIRVKFPGDLDGNVAGGDGVVPRPLELELSEATDPLRRNLAVRPIRDRIRHRYQFDAADAEFTFDGAVRFVVPG
jgi:hypothetical protein